MQVSGKKISLHGKYNRVILLQMGVNPLPQNPDF